MSGWDRDAIDLVEPGFIEFSADGTGQFGFIAVRGWLDSRPVERDDRPAVEFTWEGVDEGDQVSGRGWAVLVDDETIEGHPPSQPAGPWPTCSTTRHAGEPYHDRRLAAQRAEVVGVGLAPLGRVRTVSSSEKPRVVSFAQQRDDVDRPLVTHAVKDVTREAFTGRFVQPHLRR